MPETLEPPASQTALQADIAAKTAAAVQDTGFGKEFDLEVDAAIAKDDAKAAPVKSTDTAAAPTAPLAPVVEPPKPKPVEKPAAPGLDIPDALLGEKQKAVEEPVKAGQIDPDRQKFIEEMTKGMSTKAADRFRFVENEAYAAKQKVAQIEKELSELKTRPAAAPPDTAELDRYKKQAGELDELVQRTNLAEHPKFKAHYDTGREKEITAAKSLIADVKVASEVEALLSMPETAQRNRRLNEIVGELEPIEAGKFQAAVDRADRLAVEKASELANWKLNKTKVEELSRQEQEQTKEQRESTIKRALETVLPKFTDNEKGIELFRTVEGNEDWNKTVEDRISQVKRIAAADLSREEITAAAAWAVSGPEFRKLFLTQRVLVKKLQEELTSMKGGEPDLGESGAPTEEAETGGMIDIVSRAAQKQGAVR